MNIRQTYVFEHKLDHFSEYHAPKFYEDTGSISFKSPKQITKKKTFVSQIQKLSKAIPGVGTYALNPETKNSKSKKKPKKIEFNKLQKKGTHTYLDDIIKSKKKIPAVGKYDLSVDHTEEIRKIYKNKGDDARKKAPLFRPTALDNYNRDMLKVGPNQYQVLKPLGYKSMRGRMSPRYQSCSLPKIPSAFDYNPIPADYETFTKIKSTSNLEKGSVSSTFGSERKSKVIDQSPGPKYSLISDWVQKFDKNGMKKGHNYFKSASTSTLRHSSIYH